MTKYLSSIRKNLSISKYFFQLVIKLKKGYLPLAILSAIIGSCSYLVYVIAPGYIIDQILSTKDKEQIIQSVLITVLIGLVINIANWIINTQLSKYKYQVLAAIDSKLAYNIMKMPFAYVEDAKILDLRDKALTPMYANNVIWTMISCVISFFTNIIIAIVFLVILWNANLILIVITLSTYLINCKLYKDINNKKYSSEQLIIPLERRKNHYSEMVSDFEYGKEIRIWNAQEFILKKIKKYNSSKNDILHNEWSYISRKYGIINVIIKMQIIFSYAWNSYIVMVGKQTIGGFTTCINASVKLISAFDNIMKSYSEFGRMCKHLDTYLEFMKISENHVVKQTESVGKFEYITFKDVSFKYPNASDFTLKHINVTIRRGEKISIVGLNGSGKTTFIKLLTGLYQPTIGRILLNGQDIASFNYLEYSKLFSVVFQDFKLFSFTIRENIELYKKSDNYIISKKILEQLNLGSKIESLKNGLDTYLYKIFDEQGITFSGGEAQKIAIARALYKDGAVIVLDEPTSALDPIAESEIYSDFNKLLLNEESKLHKTDIFISHRLSSCRLCDRVIVFNEGNIVQDGSHDEIVKEIGGLYYNLWNTQAQYYK